MFSIITIVYSLHLRITPMPTSYKVKKQMFAILPMTFEGNIIECGAGWGTLAIPLAKKFPYNTVEAYELSPLPFLVLASLKKILFLKNLKVKRKDFFSVSFKEAGLIVCYLYPQAMERLGVKINQELKSQSLVVSNTFAIHSLRPKRIIHVDDLYSTTIFVY